MQKWFVSHPSGGPQHTPTFFSAVKNFAAGREDVKLMWPHALREEIHLTKKNIATADLVLAEVSIASTGSGIELGWASAAGKPIIAFYQGAQEASPAIQFVTEAIHPYLTEAHIAMVLKTLVEQD